MSEIKKKVGAWLIVALLAVAIPTGSALLGSRIEQALVVPSPAEKLVHTTWLVQTERGSGSGVAVTLPDGTVGVLTAAHVVAGETLVVLQREARGPRGPKSLLLVKADVVKVWEEWDVALLRPWAPELLTEVSTLDAKDPEVGDRLGHVGCQFGANFGFIVLRGYVTGKQYLPKLPGWPWTHPLDSTDIGFRPGSSGGPVFNADGRVVGICVGAADFGLGVYVPARDILPLLTSKK